MEGTPFGRYRLIELLGRGGMGEVWRGHDTVTDRVVAIKVLPANLSEDEEFQRRFRREAHSAARLDTPHVVPIYDYGEIDGRLFVSMRLIKGRDLDTVLAGGPLDPARAVRIIDQVAKALHAAHKVGLLHRDIKPSNILLDDDDFAYLIDFGIARIADETRMTKSGNTIGTFAYIAPERLDSQAEEDARADIYSLACVLYEALTGEPPFTGTTTPHLIAAHLNAPPPRPSTTQSTVPERFDEVIAKGMAKDPDNRYATTVELADAAREATTVPVGRPVPSPPTATQLAVPTTPPTTTESLEPASTAADPQATLVAPQRAPTPDRALTETRVARSPTGRAAPVRPAPHRRRALILTVLGVTVALAIAVITLVVTHQFQPSRSGSQPSPSGQTSAPPPPSPAVSRTVLPFTGLRQVKGLAVDTAGNVYAADWSRVVEVAAGSTTQTVLPFTGFDWAVDGVAVDGAGDVYATDSIHNRVVKLAAGSNAQTVLPFTGLFQPGGVAVDGAGAVYVCDWHNNRVVKLAAGSAVQTELPLSGIKLSSPIAVDAAGAVYITEYQGDRVVKLTAGTAAQTVLPFTGLEDYAGLAVDSTGAVYVTDSNNGRVVKLAAGSTTQTVPFTGLNLPVSIAVDRSGAVYVGEGGGVVKLQ